MYELRLGEDSVLDLYNIHHGIFSPLEGFMGSADYRRVVNEMHLNNGQPWTIPVTLDIPAADLQEIGRQKKIYLINSKSQRLATLQVEDIFKIDHCKDTQKVFGVTDTSHPGVYREVSKSPFRVGGIPNVLEPQIADYPQYALTPKDAKAIFESKGWKTVVGFQTRNPIHRAHEYLQRLGMELTDGLFVQPLIGWKKSGDINPIAIVSSYEFMMKHYYSPAHAVLGLLNTHMRYAGPREAVFHAIIRRNFGCTHFIVGRDHAGVGNYYGKYDAQKLCAQFDDLAIKIFEFCEPYYCPKCEMIVSRRSCSHSETSALSISGTDIRAYFGNNATPPKEFIRPEVGELLLEFHRRGELFIK